MSSTENHIITGGLLMLFMALCLLSDLAYGQAPDSSKVFIGSTYSLDSMNLDSTKIIEDAALDIGQDRGLFIGTPDRQMQLRILGSVRYLVVYDDRDLMSKNSLVTYQINVDDPSQKIPNYYNGLDQSRLGFEVTRKTQKGNVFVRQPKGPRSFRWTSRRGWSPHRGHQYRSPGPSPSQISFEFT